ncbi:hypothetical protein EVG20_g1452 [Dentipellis fragilis]|uniref:Uncharacterized protein n=1 Tax=Dentipellis fragilis TaxID=205917 RepID=A0A4Y9ZCK7_9AGAM|nr:hypothetical protein EVG20_g1452 [Dentipellis fragilis]
MHFSNIILVLGLALGVSAAPIYTESLGTSAVANTSTSEVPVVTHVDGFKRDGSTRGSRLAARTSSRTYVGKFRRFEDLEEPATAPTPTPSGGFTGGFLTFADPNSSVSNSTTDFTGFTDPEEPTDPTPSSGALPSDLPTGLERLKHAGVHLGSFIGFRR